MKKIIILNSPGRLANKLWLYARIYAYCLEMNYICKNYDFNHKKYNYDKYFNIAIPKYGLNILLFKYFLKLKTKYSFFKIFNKLVKIIFLGNIKLISAEKEIFFLLPSSNINLIQNNILKEIEQRHNKKFYFSGWNFNNPIGLKKYHKEITDFFKPKKEYVLQVNNFLKNLKNKYELVIGVHIRRGNYRIFCNGKYFFEFFEVNNILNNFQNNLKYSKDEIVFILCSDEFIEKDKFININYVDGPGGEITDMYTLSGCDIIIGSESTYNSWAAYYGDKPRIVFSHSEINWKDILIKFNLYGK